MAKVKIIQFKGTRKKPRNITTIVYYKTKYPRVNTYTRIPYRKNSGKKGYWIDKGDYELTFNKRRKLG